MDINFSKYHGTGNDFVLIDNRNENFPFSVELVADICHRHFGVGADGLMLLENQKDYDFKMRYFNSDGREASMCGNGGRCIVAFAKKLGIISEEARFIAFDGEYEAFIDENNKVELQMQDVNTIDVEEDSIFLDTGSPHVVKFIDNHDNFDTYTEGYKIRYSDKYKEVGSNINFVSLIKNNEINASTYERGVEDETYSCGTGCVAAAIATSVRIDSESNRYLIHTKGGILEVNFEKDGDTYSNIMLKGPTKEAFTGTYIVK